MVKIYLVVLVFGLLLGGLSGIDYNNIYNDEKIDYEKIDTGFTPEQTWDIINGEDIGLIIINSGNVNG